MAARSSFIKPLIAARPAINRCCWQNDLDFDQMSGGRITTGQNRARSKAKACA
jgi:hypothetical protein